MLATIVSYANLVRLNLEALGIPDRDEDAGGDTLAAWTGRWRAKQAAAAEQDGGEGNGATESAESYGGSTRRDDGVGADLIRWMEEHEYSSIGQMCGSMSQRNVSDPTAFERANYMKVLSSYSLRS